MTIKSNIGAKSKIKHYARRFGRFITRSQPSYYLFGIHCSGISGIYHNEDVSIGDYIRELYEHDKPRILQSVDNAGIIFEAQQNYRLHDVLVFRMTEKDGVNLDRIPVNNETGCYAGIPEDISTDRHNKITYYWPPELDRAKIWTVYYNEPNEKSCDIEYLARLALNDAKLCLRDGYKYLAWGWSGGTPEREFWENEHTLEYLRLCAEHPDQLGVSLHLYSLNEHDLFANFEWQVGRYQMLYDVCDEHNIPYPTIISGETGWGENAIQATTAEALAQLDDLQTILEGTTIIGLPIWTLGHWHGTIATDVINMLRSMIDKAKNFVSTTPPPPDTGYKSVVVKIAQEHTEEQWKAISSIAFNNYKRTQTPSTDNMVVMVEDGNDESYVFIVDPHLPSQVEAIEACTERGIRWEAIYLTTPDPEPEPEPSNPLDNLKLGFLFEYQYSDSYNGGRFNDYRSYANNKHEGLDADVIGGQVDNKVDVLCTYDGKVTASLDSSGGYGKYVVVEHVNNGSPFYTWYCHLDERFANVGDVLTKGAAIGEVGATGNVTGEHVHFNLQVPNYGFRGYVIDWVVDPFNYLPSGNLDLPPITSNPDPDPGQVIDMLPYYSPASGAYGRISIKDTSWNGQVRQQIQAHDGYLYVTKGNEIEVRKLIGDKIFFLLDDSPGNGEYYTVQSDSGWIPRYFEVGSEFSRVESNQFFRKSDCAGLNKGSNWNNTIRFTAFHETWSTPDGLQFSNVAHLQWIINGVVEEDYFLGVGLGYVGWKNRHGLSSYITSFGDGQGNNTFKGSCYWNAFGVEYP